MGVDEADPVPECPIIPFIFTRAMVTLAGVSCLLALAVVLVDDLSYLFPRPPEPTGGDEVVVHRGHGLMKRPMILDFVVGLLFSALPVSAMILVWRHPRTGFLLSGLGWALLHVAGILWCFFQREEGIRLGWTWAAIFLPPLLWLSYAWWKVGPTPVRTS